MDLNRKVWIQEGPCLWSTILKPFSSFKHAKETEPSHSIVSIPFRLLDLPFEIRSEILCRATSSTDHYWLDREVIICGELLKLVYYIRGHTVWRDSNDVYMNLLTTSKHIYEEVQQILESFKTPNHLPKHRIMHIAYTPYFTEYMREHCQSVNLILSGLPLLSSARILISWACAQRLVICGDTRAGSLYIVAVARLFRQVRRVAVVGQFLLGELQKQLLMEARRELEDEPWY
ncbi:hypothetical protein V8F44DRAFT_662868 [Aspergillus fumigatus]